MTLKPLITCGASPSRTRPSQRTLCGYCTFERDATGWLWPFLSKKSSCFRVFSLKSPYIFFRGALQKKRRFLGEHRLFTLRNNVSICGFLAQRQKRKHDKGTAKGTLNSVVLIYASFDFLWNESFTILGEVQSNLCMAFVAFHSIERFAW